MNNELNMGINYYPDDLQMDDNSDGPGFSTPTSENSPFSQLYKTIPRFKYN